MKTKNLFWSVLAMSGMLFATSCSQDELVKESSEEFVSATFTIGTADGIGTRSAESEAGIIGKGVTVNKVACAVYDAGGNHLSDLYNVVDITDKKATFETRLAKGQSYRVAFFAYNEVDGKKAYEWVNGLTNITVNTDQLSNLESRDAFTNYCDVETGVSAINETVTLKRPFAQLNLGVDDAELAAAKSAGIEIEESEIIVTNVYTAFNAFENKVSGTPVESMTFKMNAIPTEKLQVKVDGVDKEYNYLALNYLLVGNLDSPKSLTDVTFNWKAEGDKKNDCIIDFKNIPVQRNYRTNIIGKLLTNPATFNIVIDDEFFKVDNNIDNPDHTILKVFNAADLQEAIDAAKAGFTTTIYLGNDIVGDVTILQKEGVNLVIDGSEYKFDGVINVNGNARANGEETLTFKNIKFETTAEELTFISAPSKVDGKYNYSHNITVDNCSFYSATYNDGIASINLTGTYNFVLKNSKAENIHSLVQIQSCDNNVTIENVEVLNCKNGLSLGNIANATISCANISATGYGLRLDGTTARTVSATIKNSEINAFIPVSIRKMNADDCNVEISFEGENDLEGTSFDIAICSNEYEDGKEPVAPKGTYTLNGAEGLDVWFGSVVSKSALTAAISNTSLEEINVSANIDNVGLGFEVKRDVVLNFNNNELNAGSDANSRWYAIEATGYYNVEINDANFTRAGVYAAKNANVVFNSGVINHKPERSSRYIFCAQSGSTIVVEDGTFYNDRSNNAYFWADNATIYVKGGNFGGVESKNKVVVTNGGQVIINGGTFNFNPEAWVAEGYVATKSGSTWTVTAVVSE